MSEFQLNSSVDREKVFIVNFSEVEGRLDPNFNQALRKNIIKSNYPLKRISKIVISSISGGTPSKNISEYWDGGNIPWASPKDIKTFKLTKTIDSITEEGVENSSTNVIKSNNLIIVYRALKEGEINCTINQRSIAINQDLKALYLSDDVIPDYLMYFFDVFGRKIFPLITKLGTTVYSINSEQFNRLRLPIPPKKIQQEIINIYEIAYTQKQQKETEAKKLLASIDDYLLNELGITLPEKDNSLENRIFTTFFSKMSGGRFDPKLYDNNTQGIRNAINKTSFDKPLLKDLIIHSVAGDWGKDEKEKLGDKFKKCLVIRATEFDNLYNLKLDNNRVKYRFISKEKLDRIDVQENDLLIEKSGGSPDQPVGRISILTNEILKDYSIGYSNFIHKIRVNSSKINPEYLFCYLKTVHNIKLTDAMQSQTNGIRNLIMSNYFNQIIPLPSLDKQTIIADYISDLRAKAKQLELEAQDIVNKAKEEIEQIILA